ncbi:hypothetical protein KQP61_11480 [Bacteroides faecis]|jgi:hypothetical protein|uniref:Response regulator n=2 Tax=Bacteroidales TaxID=171549 RepID=A0A415M3I2_BACT4|nr:MULTISPECIES: hypothetical protein [Bacteroides]KAA5270461.1 hypothetical protein F2Z41_06375 [Bacteroides faecis]MCE9009235.1 hypothetical protein [Bacteroides faecis]RHL62283.1 hypothetical protein DW011_05330 [Bacteroides thetaiotaomicron]RYT90294.1 hypothetical protein EAJ04_06435 [Bacteroides faecis]UYU59176.1 hypothetical protein KQP61_11480 [Bacteroides faecis]
MGWFKHKRYTIKDLNTPSRKIKSASRDRFKIAIIDDEDFVFLEELRKSGFDIRKYDDALDLQMFDSYPIIICDIKGVGKDFKSPMGGAFLIRELKKKYPLKAYAAYTGSTYDISINNYLEGVSIIKKDIEIDDWCIEIDNLIRNISDPKEVWLKIRDILLKEEVDLISLANLEDEYVDIILNKNGDFHNFPSAKKENTLNPDVRAVVQSLVAGIILNTL